MTPRYGLSTPPRRSVDVPSPARRPPGEVILRSRPIPAAALALLAALLVPADARADRLGGNYRGPGDTWGARDDAPPPKGDGAPPPGEGGDAPAPPPGGGGGEDGSSAGDGTSGGGEGAPPPSGGDGGEGTYRGPSGETPPEDRPPDGGPPPDGAGGGPPPDGAGGGSSGGTETGGEGGGGTGPGASPSAPGGGGGGSGPAVGGARPSVRGAIPDDRDRVWPFYFEGAKEEYLLAVLRRREATRLSPPRSSTFLLSPLPEPAGGARPVGETGRARARVLLMGRVLDPDSHVRDAAFVALGKSGSAEALPFLERAAFADPDREVREDALLALGLSGRSREALPALLHALETPTPDPRERRRAFAALGLGLLGDREGAVPPLRDLFRSAAARPEGIEDAACAAVALALLGDTGSLEAFERVALSRGAPEDLRSSVLHAVGKFGGHGDEAVRRRALGILGAALPTKRAGVHRAAVLALGSFDDAAAVSLLAGNDGLLHPDPHARTYAAHALGRIAARRSPGSPEQAAVARVLAEASGSDRKDRWLFQAGNLALGSVAWSGREEGLAGLLADDREMARLSPYTASSVVIALGLLGGGPEPVSRRIGTLFRSRAAGSHVRAYAGLALALSGAPGAAGEVGSVLSADDGTPPADVARTAALSLGILGGPEEARILVDVLRGARLDRVPAESRGFLLGAAVQGIGLIGDADSVELLAPLLESRDWRTRAFATAALGYLAEPDPARRASPRLSEIFRHHDYTRPLPVVRAVMSML